MKKYLFFIKLITNNLLEILFSSRCLGCDKRNQILCENCIKNLKYTDRITEDNIIALYDYRDPIIKKAIWNLKYYHSRIIGQKLGELLYRELKEEIAEIKRFSLGSPVYVIPVPISHNRKNNRGYNQSEIIARSFCNYENNNAFQLKTNIIFKKINTEPQAKISNRIKRIKNIKGVFGITNIEIIKGKTIIIIDDVTTTGATMLEIIKILNKNGAKKVIGFAVAH